MLLQLHWSLANLASGKLAAEESEHSITQQNTFDAVLSVFNFQQLYWSQLFATERCGCKHVYDQENASEKCNTKQVVMCSQIFCHV